MVLTQPLQQFILGDTVPEAYLREDIVEGSFSKNAVVRDSEVMGSQAAYFSQTNMTAALPESFVSQRME